MEYLFFPPPEKSMQPAKLPASVKVTTLRIPSGSRLLLSIKKPMLRAVSIMQTPETNAVSTAFFFLTRIAFAPAKKAVRKLRAELI